MARRHYAGNAKPTTLTADIANNATTIAITDATGWPTGGANGKFFITIDRGNATEERILVQSRSGTSLTVASTGDRGVDGTSAAAHSAGASVEHTVAGVDFDEANQHINDVAQDHHTQYMLASGTRHDLTARHLVGTTIPAGTPGNLAIGDTASGGAATSAARSDHRHGMPAFANPVAVGTAIGGGAAATVARSDHVHELGAGSIDTSSFFANNVIPIGAIADGLITLAKFASEAFTTYTPTLTNVALGSGGFSYGARIKLGRMVFGIAGFRLGTGGNVTGEVRFSPPPGITPADRVSDATIGNMGWLTAARAFDPGTATWSTGLGVVADDAVLRNFVTVGGSAVWDANTPWDWNDGDIMQIFFALEATA